MKSDIHTREPNYEKICENCGDVFKRYIRPRWIEKGRAPKFCSAPCAKSSKKDRIELTCDCCGKLFERARSKVALSRSGYHFCCRACKDKAQRVENINEFKDMMPGHYGTGNGLSGYRKKAIDYYGALCRVCGYNIVEVLQVHHKDKDRNNNDLDNLDVLCPTHHWEYHMGMRNY